MPETERMPDRYVNAIERGKVAKQMALGFLQTVSVNLDNEELSDEDFRQFMRNSMRGIPCFGYKENGET